MLSVPPKKEQRKTKELFTIKIFKLKYKELQWKDKDKVEKSCTEMAERRKIIQNWRSQISRCKGSTQCPGQWMK